MSKSIKTNFLFNVINTVMGLLFPLITFPYATRILMAEGIGQVNFFNSIINYIVLFAGLGIPIYGVREIARVRDDSEELTKTTIEILSLNLILTLVGYTVVVLFCFTIPEIKENVSLFLVLSLTLLLNAIGCNWFYSGIEEFKFIAVRSLVFRLLSLIILFGLVKTKEDLLYYGIFTVFTNVGSYLLNFLSLLRYMRWDTLSIRKLNIKRHIGPACTVFMFSIVTSIYLNLDKVMLGFIQDSSAVGYYTAASQISHILLTLVVSLGTVLLPRASNLIKNGKIDEFYKMTEKSYHFILLLSMPISFGCMVLSQPLIHVLCGNSYEPAIKTLVLISPIILIIGISQLIGMQVFYPLGKIKTVTLSTCSGALVNLILNAILIPHLAQDGAAISTVAAEFSVTLSLLIFAKGAIPFKLFSITFFRYLGCSLIMAIFCFSILKTTAFEDWQYLILIPVIGGLVYGCMLYVLKDNLLNESINMILTKVKK